ncbi:MAG: hypothetical protein IH614_12070, partial [Desulfuromonadales bacterium]|nr:hypothetical protein [Desulfuromonadales bacterium]
MLIYRNSHRPERTAHLLGTLATAAATLADGEPSHDAVRDLLVAFDTLEGGIADRLNPQVDDLGPCQAALRQTALALATTFLDSLAGRRRATRCGLQRLTRQLAALEQHDLPEIIEVAQAEGYAWYALFPEAYVLAARQFQAEVAPQAAVCLGLRQIGGSLSAVVAAAIAETGCPVQLFNARPRGDPFA